MNRPPEHPTPPGVEPDVVADQVLARLVKRVRDETRLGSHEAGHAAGHGEHGTRASAEAHEWARLEVKLEHAARTKLAENLASPGAALHARGAIPRRRAVTRRWALALALPLAAGALLFLLRPSSSLRPSFLYAPTPHLSRAPASVSPPPPLSYDLQGRDGARDEHGTTVRFSEGTAFQLDKGARARVAEVSARGARLELAHGRVHADVVPLPDARWSIVAGPYTVRVTGTVFDVRWDEAAGELDLRLHRGHVVVTGPLAPKGIAMDPHQHLVARLHAEELRLEQGPLDEAGDQARDEATEDDTASRPAGAPSARATAGRAASPVRRDSWRELLRRGDFNAVVEDAERHGLAGALASRSADELAALADAARYARRAGLARRVLLAERRRFPSSTGAHESSFFLGGLAEGDGGASGAEEALRWYERYLDENPRGTYRAQSEGRRMALLARLGRRDEARRAARAYLGHEPQGPWATAARDLLAEP